MSTYGTATRNVPILTIRIEDHYSDDNGYSRLRRTIIDTFAGTFTFYHNTNLRYLLRHPSAIRAVIEYARPYMYMDYTDNAEHIKQSILNAKARQAERKAFQKLTPQKQQEKLRQLHDEALVQARASYARTLRNVGREDDANTIEAGGAVEVITEADIENMANTRYGRYADFLTS